MITNATNQLYEARAQCCEYNAGEGRDEKWRLLGEMVQLLGPDGQSSDESDTEGYVVRAQPWRGVDVGDRLDYIDTTRKTQNKTEYGRNRSGAQFRRRIRPARPPQSHRAAKPGLPSNFYDQVWYTALGVGTLYQREIDAAPATRLAKLYTNPT